MRATATARMSGRLPTAGVAALVALLLMTLTAPAAHAGEWMQVSCVNPNGTAAPFQGWTGSNSGSPEFGSNDDVACSPGSPMVANLSAEAQPAPGVANEFLTYAPPAGSTLVGGTMNVSMYGGGSGTNATAVAGLYEPVFNSAPADRFLVCARILGPCQNGGYTWSGTATLPANRGGNLIAAASCASNSGGTCSTNVDANNNYADVFISQADLLLQSNAVPSGSGFTGTVLEPGARGLTASHVHRRRSRRAGRLPGPDVRGRHSGVRLRRRASTRASAFRSATDEASGALMFDYQQPCPQVESVDVPISTTGLQDGRHELSVTVTDAAGNVATALDQTITTSNPLVTPSPAKGVRAQFVMRWHWIGARTTLRSIAVRKLPRGARTARQLRRSRLPQAAAQVRDGQPRAAPAGRAARPDLPGR